MSNLTYFRTTDMGKRTLLSWFEKNQQVEKVREPGRTYVGIFPKLYKEFLDEIVAASGKGKRSTSAYSGMQTLGLPHSSSQQSLRNSDSPRGFDRESTAYELIKIFEHVNFFNLFLPEIKAEDIESVSRY